MASITIEAYVYWAGKVGLLFAQSLAKRAKAGGKVKILLDAIGSASIGPENLAVGRPPQRRLKTLYNRLQGYRLQEYVERLA